VLDEIGDERATTGVFVHVFAEFSIERDRSFQQDGCDVFMLEAAGAHEGLVDGCEIVRALGKSGADGVDITERGKKLERARQQAVTLKQLQLPPGAGQEETLTYLSRDHCAGVNQKLGACSASEPSFSFRVACVPVGERGHREQATAFLPGKQHRVFSQQLSQTLDVVVVNDASSLRHRPIQTPAEPLAHLGGQVLPAVKAVFPRDHELSVTLRQRRIDIRQVCARTRDGVSVTGGDVARELLCLLAQGFQRWTSGQKLRRGHGDLLS
jgi:hypothetical protein